MGSVEQRVTAARDRELRYCVHMVRVMTIQKNKASASVKAKMGIQQTTHPEGLKLANDLSCWEEPQQVSRANTRSLVFFFF